ncbi:hypothetical protein D3C77_706510 [compost metagenome]
MGLQGNQPRCIAHDRTDQISVIEVLALFGSFHSVHQIGDLLTCNPVPLFLLVQPVLLLKPAQLLGNQRRSLSGQGSGQGQIEPSSAADDGYAVRR